MTTRTLTLSALIFGFVFPGVAFANPSMAGGGMGRGAETSFTRMDTNKDGKATREEFFATFPQMKEGAFTSIDTNVDGAISKEEWLMFSKGHASDEAAAHPGGEGTLPAGHPPMGNGTMPSQMKGANGTMLPPMKSANGTAPAPAGKAPDLIMPSK